MQEGPFLLVLPLSHVSMDALADGRIPNLYWKGMSMDYLRACPRFEPLPPVQEVRLSDLASYRSDLNHAPLWHDI
jgi:hypothetical protein